MNQWLNKKAFCHDNNNLYRLYSAMANYFNYVKCFQKHELLDIL